MFTWIKKRILRHVEKQKRLYRLKYICSSQEMFDAALEYCEKTSWTIDHMIDFVTITGQLPGKNLGALPAWTVRETIATKKAIERNNKANKRMKHDFKPAGVNLK